jgi:O-antigen/teichoic acid export membrane protein
MARRIENDRANPTTRPYVLQPVPGSRRHDQLALCVVSTLPDRRSSPLPDGTIPIGVGLVLSGVCAYAFLALAKASLTNEQLVPIQQLWFMTFALAPGFFLPLEQEVARAVSHRRAHGEGGLPVIRRAAVIGAVIAALLLLAIAVAGGVLTKHAFKGNSILVPGLMLAVVSFAATHLGRGVLSGSGQFGGYGIALGGDAAIRLALCALILLLGAKSVGAFGFAVGIPPLVALAIAFWGRKSVFVDGPEAPWGEVTRNLGWLLVGSIGAAFIVNAGPIVANLLATEADSAKSATWSVGTDPEKWTSKVEAFSSGVLIARVPLFLFQAIQAALLPKLARLAARGAFDEFRSGFRKLMVIVGVVIVAGTVGAALAGPFVLRIAFKARLTAGDLGLLAFGAGVYMAAIATAQALIALRGHRRVALGWIVGLAALGATLALKGDVEKRVEVALIVAPAASLAIFAWSLRAILRSGATIDADSVVEALHVPVADL